MRARGLCLSVILVTVGCSSPEPDVSELEAQIYADWDDPPSELYAKRMERKRIKLRPALTAGPWDGRYAVWLPDAPAGPAEGALELEVRLGGQDYVARLTDRRGAVTEFELERTPADVLRGTANLDLDWPNWTDRSTREFHHERICGLVSLHLRLPGELDPTVDRSQDPDPNEGVFGVYSLEVEVDGEHRSIGLERLED